MFRNLFVLLALLLSGCVFYVDDAGSTSNYESTYIDGVWLESPYISCSYDSMWGVSDWSFEVYADSSYGPYEVAEVGFFINGYDYHSMNDGGDAWWYLTFTSTAYSCADYYYFDFVAIDYDGYEGHYVYDW